MRDGYKCWTWLSKSFIRSPLVHITHLRHTLSSAQREVYPIDCCDGKSMHGGLGRTPDGTNAYILQPHRGPWNGSRHAAHDLGGLRTSYCSPSTFTDMYRALNSNEVQRTGGWWMSWVCVLHGCMSKSAGLIRAEEGGLASNLSLPFSFRMCVGSRLVVIDLWLIVE